MSMFEEWALWAQMAADSVAEGFGIPYAVLTFQAVVQGLVDAGLVRESDLLAASAEMMRARGR